MFVVRELGLSAGVDRARLLARAVGSLVAAFTAMRISARFGIGPTTIAMAAALRARRSFSIALAPAGNAAIPFLVAAQLVLGFAVVVYNIVQVSYRQAICPPRLQGRMNSVMRFMVWGTIPLGARRRRARRSIGLRETLVVGAVGGGLVVPLDPALAAAAPARDAGAGRRLGEPGPADDVMPEPASVWRRYLHRDA